MFFYIFFLIFYPFFCICSENVKMERDQSPENYTIQCDEGITVDDAFNPQRLRIITVNKSWEMKDIGDALYRDYRGILYLLDPSNNNQYVPVTQGNYVFYTINQLATKFSCKSIDELKFRFIIPSPQ